MDNKQQFIINLLKQEIDKNNLLMQKNNMQAPAVSTQVPQPQLSGKPVNYWNLLDIIVEGNTPAKPAGQRQPIKQPNGLIENIPEVKEVLGPGQKWLLDIIVD